MTEIRPIVFCYSRILHVDKHVNVHQHTFANATAYLKSSFLELLWVFGIRVTVRACGHGPSRLLGSELNLNPRNRVLIAC